jgi:small GTP-binding protein
MTSNGCCYSSFEEQTIPVILVSAPKLTYKISVLGDAGCGKTTLIHRLVHGVLLEGSEPTAGAGYSEYVLEGESRRIPCQIWDTAGQEKFSSLVPVYIRGADLCIIALSLVDSEETNRSSLKRWSQVVKDVTDSCLIIVVGTKFDLPHTGLNIELPYVATSSVLGHGIQELRDAITTSISSL